MRRIATLVIGAALVLGSVVGSASSASASAAPADKPVVTIGHLTIDSSGGASYDTWRTYVTAPVSGYNFTPGGNVYVTYQDVTAGTAALSGEWTRAGSGVCGPECNNPGKLSYTRTINFRYRAICGHVLRAWAWDETKSPNPAYGWSYRDVVVSC